MSDSATVSTPSDSSNQTSANAYTNATIFSLACVSHVLAAYSSYLQDAKTTSTLNLSFAAAYGYNAALCAAPEKTRAIASTLASAASNVPETARAIAAGAKSKGASLYSSAMGLFAKTSEGESVKAAAQEEAQVAEQSVRASRRH